jgi:hypothetical protein
MKGLEISIEGIGFWGCGWPDWASARAGLRGEQHLVEGAPQRPPASILTPAERRRAPDPVLLACEVAAQACTNSGRDAATLPSIFASTHGDLVITDYMCSTLATAPRELSPIRFHNSVHNAPAGYWTIAAHCHAASTSVSGWYASFGSALFEAAVEAIAGDTPVLLAAYDVESRGPLSDVTPSTAMFGVALVIAPASDEAKRLRISVPVEVGDGEAAALPGAFAELAAANPMAATALPFLHALATDQAQPIRVPVSSHRSTRIEVLA